MRSRWWGGLIVASIALLLTGCPYGDKPRAFESCEDWNGVEPAMIFSYPLSPGPWEQFDMCFSDGPDSPSGSRLGDLTSTCFYNCPLKGEG